MNELFKEMGEAFGTFDEQTKEMFAPLHKTDKQRCSICTFDDGQVIEIPDGLWAHRECLEDQEDTLHPNRYSPQKELDDYIKQEKDSHLHA